MSRALLAAFAVLACAACTPAFVPARVTEPIAASDGVLQVAVERLWVTEDLPLRGVGADSALVVQLAVTNPSGMQRTISPASASCLMEVDSSRPAETRALLPTGGGEGPFPGEIPEEGNLLASVVIPPGQTRPVWVLFRGYRFPDSDLPRKVSVRIPSPGGLPLELVLADPARGRRRWEVAPQRTGASIGFQNGALFGGVEATQLSTQFARVWRAGPILWELGLSSTLMIQTKGPLTSGTSSFAGTGLMARLTVPLLEWGSPLDPRQLGIYMGGSATLFAEIAKSPPPGDMTPPKVYGALSADLGLELDVGALRLGETPFPLSPTGRSVPRWFVRVGYTHWRIGPADADGYVTSLRLAW